MVGFDRSIFRLKTVRRTRQQRGWAGASLVLLALWLGAALSGMAQETPFGKIKNWKIFDLYEPATDPDAGTNQLKMMLSGVEAIPKPRNVIDVSDMWLGSFDRDGGTNLVARAPVCLVDMNERVVSSTGPLQIETARGQLSIRGQGFHCRLTNIVLLISNQVETLVHRELIQKSPAAGRLPVAESDGPGLTNQPLRIFSDHFLFHQLSNLVVYTGNVRVRDPALEMTCHRLVLTLNTNGGIEQVEALQDVVLTGATNTTRAFGDRAIYRIGQTNETVELTGEPSRWVDGRREGRGRRFVYDPGRNLLLAPEPSLVRLPRREVVQPGFDWAASTGSGAEPDDAPAEFVEVAAETMAFSMPGTNRAPRAMVASNDVVILSPADQSRATGRRIAYSAETGLLELSGDATWESKGRRVQGETFQFDRSNHVFRVLTQAQVRLPMAALGSNPALARWFRGAENTQTQSQYLTVTSEELVYRTNRLDFLRDVRARLQQEETVTGSMESRRLTLHFSSNRVERVVAQENVRMRQPPTLSSSSNLVEKQLESERFTVQLGTHGFVEEMQARTNVLVRQIEYPSGSAAPVRTDLRAEVVTAWFRPATNEVDRIVAEQDVVIEQVSGRATGDQATYNRAEDTLVLSGNVTLETPNGMLNAPAAILRHFGLWPGRLGRIGVPLGSNRPAPADSSASEP